MKRPSTLWRSRPARLLTLGSAMLLVQLVDVSLRLWGYRRTAAWMLRLSPTPTPHRHDDVRTRALARLIIKAADRLGAHASCLRRTLALWYALRWLRLPSDVRIGLNRDGGHAWLEHHGHVLTDAPDVAARYAVLDDGRLTPTVLANLA